MGMDLYDKNEGRDAVTTTASNSGDAAAGDPGAEIVALEKHFKFLDHLRESGVTNMYGAAPYLIDAHGLDREEARSVLMKWMDTFDGRSIASDRAARATGATP